MVIDPAEHNPLNFNLRLLYTVIRENQEYLILRNQIARPTIVIRYSDGSRFSVGSGSTSDYFLDTSFLRFFFLAVVIFAALVEPRTPDDISTAKTATMWLFVAVASLLWLSLSYQISRVMIKIGLLDAIYTPLMVFPLLLVTEAVQHFFINIMYPMPLRSYEPDLAYLITILFALICFDLIHGRFVAPLHPLVIKSAKLVQRENRSISPRGDDQAQQDNMPDIAPAAQVKPDTTGIAVQPSSKPGESQTPDTAPKVIVIGTSEFEPQKIKLIRSEEHYLSIDTDDESKLLRAKMSEAASELGLTFGMQINRSVWVAYREISQMANLNGKLELELKNGEVLIVPRARKQAFLQAYDLFSKGTRI